MNWLRPFGTGKKRPVSRRFRPALTWLEDRIDPATLTVSAATVNELRDAIFTANADQANDYVIDLTAPVYSFAAIPLTGNATQDADFFWFGPTALPVIRNQVVITGGSDGALLQRETGADPFRFFVVSAGISGGTDAAGSLTLRNLTLDNGLAQGGRGADGTNGGGGGGGGAGLGGAIFNQGTLRLDGVTISNSQAIGGLPGAGADLTSSTSGGGGGGGGGIGTDATGGTGGEFGPGFSTAFGGSGGVGAPTPDPLQSGGGGGGGGFRPGDNGADGSGTSGGIGQGSGSNGGSNGGDGSTISSVAGSTGIGNGGNGGAFGFGGQPGQTSNRSLARGYTAGGGGGGGVGGGGGGGGGANANAGQSGASATGAEAGAGGFGAGGGGGGAGNSITPGGTGTGGNANVGGFGGGGGGGGAGNTTAGLGAEAGYFAAFGDNATTTRGGDGGAGAGYGGAVFTMFGSTEVVNSTFANNAAIGWFAGVPAVTGDFSRGLGGAIFNLNGAVVVTSATFGGNISRSQEIGNPTNFQATPGGAIANLFSTAQLPVTNRALMSITNTAIGGSAATSDVANDFTAGQSANTSIVGSSNIFQGGVNPDVSGTNPSFNLVVAFQQVDPLFDPAGLANNGGPTQTITLQPGSPAINAGNNGAAAALVTDQRGFAPRAANGAVDIGAVEVGATPATGPLITSAPTTTFPVGRFGSFTVTTAPGNPVGTVLTVTGGDGLPPGVTLTDNGDGTATLAGTPTVAGTFFFTLVARNTPSTAGTQAFILTVTGGSPANQNAVSQYGTSGDAGGAAVRNAGGTVVATDPGPGGEGTRIAVADFTSDGVPDSVLATGPGVRVTVTVVNGADGNVVRSFPVFEDTFTGGAFVAAGDVTGDGIPDIAVSADNTGGARVLVFDGATGAVLADFFGIDDPSFRGGARVAFGDVNGDGLSDLIVAAGTGGGPRVAVFDGASILPGVTPTRLVNDFYAFEQTLRDGLFVTAGDVNGDGDADLIFGGGPGGGPRVLIWDSRPFFVSGGTDVRPLADFFAADPTLSTGVRVAAKDLDGDVFSDLVVGVPLGAGSVVKTYLGQSFTPTGTPPVATEIDPGVGGVFVG